MTKLNDVLIAQADLERSAHDASSAGKTRQTKPVAPPAPRQEADIRMSLMLSSWLCTHYLLQAYEAAIAGSVSEYRCDRPILSARDAREFIDYWTHAAHHARARWNIAYAARAAASAEARIELEKWLDQHAL